jgi:cysteine-S-conjugate beta-lyase
MCDLRQLAAAAHRHGVLLSVDSTMMPPVICKPLSLGADIVVHSATKFFSGHADCTGSLVCVRDPELAHRVAFLQNAAGTALAPFESFFFLRGIKRVERAQESAAKVADFLMKHPMITGVFFPGHGGCDAKSLAIHRSQAIGQGSMISITTGSVEFSRRFCDACQIFKTTVSFGSVNSLCEIPCTMSHASIPAEKRTLPER